MKWIPLLLIAILPSAGNAQDDAPMFILGGFDVLVSQGAGEAIDHWAASWTSEADQLRRAQLRQGFVDLFDGLGDPSGYEVVATKWLGSRVVDVFAVSFHSGQPLFFHITGYDSPENGWMATWVNANTTIADIYPDWVRAGHD